jgi:predicted GNAT family N-acyltransferase
MMLKVEKVQSDEALAHCFAIRKTVFVVEQQVPEDEEYDEFEATSHHFLASLDGKPVGTARFRKTDKGIKLERFAVLKEARKSGVGSALLIKLLQELKHEPLLGEVYLHAQLQAEPFYAKHGFVAKGPLFYECDIPHHKMVWQV